MRTSPTTALLCGTVLGWIAGASCVAAVGSTTAAIIAGVIAVDCLVVVGAACSSPLTSERWNVVGERIGRATSPAHLLALAAVGGTEVLVGHGPLARIGGLTLALSSFLLFIARIQRQAEVESLRGSANPAPSGDAQN